MYQWDVPASKLRLKGWSIPLCDFALSYIGINNRSNPFPGTDSGAIPTTFLQKNGFYELILSLKWLFLYVSYNSFQGRVKVKLEPHDLDMTWTRLGQMSVQVSSKVFTFLLSHPIDRNIKKYNIS